MRNTDAEDGNEPGKRERGERRCAHCLALGFALFPNRYPCRVGGVGGSLYAGTKVVG